MHVVIAILCAVCAGGWGYVMWASKGNTEVIDQVIAFDATRGDSLQITFEVVKPSDRAALCRLRATDVNHVEVGSKEVNIPAGEGYSPAYRTARDQCSRHFRRCPVLLSRIVRHLGRRSRG